MTRWQVLPTVQAQTYLRSDLHSEACIWVEKNCYVDLFIELIHALQLDPRAMLPFTLALDFEGDQWTFFKPQHSEMRQLYGIDVQEMSCWRPLVEHAQEHLSAGRLIALEADAHWLPDTAGTDYHQNHVKTTIMLADLDLERQRLGYFHNAGYFQLAGEDFRQLFRLDAPVDPSFMPFFAELVRIDRLVRRPVEELAAMSRELTRTYLGYRPASNPVTRFALRLANDLPVLQDKGLTHYHAWAFNTMRQLGAAFELASAHALWLGEVEGPARAAALAPAVTHFQAISLANKALILKVARAVNAKRSIDLDSVFVEMADAWEQGMACLAAEI